MALNSPGAAGWFSDPLGRYEMRYWDGGRWTDAVSTGGVVESDPTPVPERSADLGGPPPPVPATASGPPPGAGFTRQTTLGLAETRDRLAYLLPMAGITVTGVSDTNIQGSAKIRNETNVALLVVLLLFCIVGGVIYLIVQQRGQQTPVAITLSPIPTGTLITMAGSQAAWNLMSGPLSQLPW